MIDSRPETLKHIGRVKELMGQVSDTLTTIAAQHDASKLEEPEKTFFDTATARLKTLEYGTPQYKEALKDLKPALDHHYAANSHHPEHHPEGILGMDLLDLVELLADWKAAGERHSDNKGLRHSIQINAERFGYGPVFESLLTRTAERLGWV